MTVRAAFLKAFPYELNALQLVDSIASCAGSGAPPASELIQRGAADQLLAPLTSAVTWSAAECARASCCGVVEPTPPRIQV